MAMLSLECSRCNYKFSAKVMPKKCPYCDKVGGIALAKSAQDLIDETISDSSQFG